MANATELPGLVTEFVDLSKEYLRQETIEPAKQLGRFAGYSLAAALLFSLGGLFLSIAGMRWIVSAMPGEHPDNPYWEGLGYVVAALAIAAVGALIVYAGTRSSGEEAGR